MKQGELPLCVKPDWQMSPKVHAFTTTRMGGVSKPPFGSMNLGLHVNDDPQSVAENRRRLLSTFKLPASPAWLNQTHSNRMVKLGNEPADSQADGSYTMSKDTVLCVMTADCLPVVISDEIGTQIAVVHAGWRGLANGVLKNAIACFDQSLPLHAWLGPAIGPTKFEVGEDVRKAFVSRTEEAAVNFKKTDKEGKYLADLYALARTELTHSGCGFVTGADYCTHSQADLFHSHRRDGVRSGRMATLVWIDSDA